ncbi:MAG TPA: ABC transporter substrate-binding protein [Caulobacteraceae bacterium]
MSYRSAILAAALIGATVPAAATAQAADPAAAQIEAFDNSLLSVMRQAKSLGVQGRYRELEPVMARTFDLPTMTRFAVGPKWATVPSGDQAALTRAFSRLAVSFFAKNFDDYSGQSFKIDANVDTRGPDKLVRTHIVSPHDKTEDLTYRMRQAADGRWKVIDVYYKSSISQLAVWRSDFTSTMNAGGAPALTKKIDALADKQLR